jgi:hypothetical protein
MRAKVKFLPPQVKEFKLARIYSLAKRAGLPASQELG